jgi:hypothetical protein
MGTHISSPTPLDIASTRAHQICLTNTAADPQSTTQSDCLNAEATRWLVPSGLRILNARACRCEKMEPGTRYPRRYETRAPWILRAG